MAIVYLYGRYTSKYYSYIANKCRIVSYYLHRTKSTQLETEILYPRYQIFGYTELAQQWVNKGFGYPIRH